jgi:TIR domain
MPERAPFEVFYSYAHEDETLRDELEKHLKLLQREGLISNWHDRRIEPGGDWQSEIDSHCQSADIILLLVSADFISSDYCYGVEMKEALRRHERHEAIVIPIILRPVDWHSAPFARFQALPRDGKAITTWLNRDEAFADVSRGIRYIVHRFTPAESSGATNGTSDSRISRQVPKDRVLDAAIPSHVVKDQSTELLAKIRLPGSPGLVGTLLEDEDAEAKPEDVRSARFDVVFPIEPDGRPGDLRVEITLTSPDFRPGKQAKVMLVPPDEDSDTCYFLLTPTRMGQLRVLIELRWEEALRGSRRLRTECVATAESIPVRSGMSVVQMKLGAGLERGDEHPTYASPVPMDPAYYNSELAPSPRSVEASPRPSPSSPPLSSSSRPVEASSSPRSPARRGWLTPAIAVAIIGAISSITVGYLQFGRESAAPPPANPVTADIVLRWQLINSKTLETVPDARVTVSFDSSVPPSEGMTDHAGTYSIKVPRSSVGSLGKIIVHADNFKAYSKDFAVSSNNGNEQLLLDPVSESPPTKINQKTTSTAGLIAGRVIDSEDKSAISHALVSLSGRPESALTDDAGNYRILVTPRVANQIFRLQVEKAGCTPIDRNVQPPEENLMLELHCGARR